MYVCIINTGNALEMVEQSKDTAHHYDEVDESAIKFITAEMTAAEPSIRITTEETHRTRDADGPTPQETVSEVLVTHTYSSLASVHSLPDIPVYSTLETTSTTTDEVERAKDNPIIEVH